MSDLEAARREFGKENRVLYDYIVAKTSAQVLNKAGDSVNLATDVDHAVRLLRFDATRFSKIVREVSR